MLGTRMLAVRTLAGNSLSASSPAPVQGRQEPMLPRRGPVGSSQFSFLTWLLT